MVVLGNDGKGGRGRAAHPPSLHHRNHLLAFAFLHDGERDKTGVQHDAFDTMRVRQILLEHGVTVRHGEAKLIELRGDFPKKRLFTAFPTGFATQFQRDSDDSELLAHVQITVIVSLIAFQIILLHDRRTVGDRHGTGQQVEFPVFAFQNVTVSHASHADLTGQPVEERHETLFGFLAFRITGTVQQCARPRNLRIQPYSPVRRGRSKQTVFTAGTNEAFRTIETVSCHFGSIAFDFVEFFYIAGFDSNGSKCYKPSKNGKIPPLGWMFEEGFL